MSVTIEPKDHDIDVHGWYDKMLGVSGRDEGVQVVLELTSPPGTTYYVLLAGYTISFQMRIAFMPIFRPPHLSPGLFR